MRVLQIIDSLHPGGAEKMAVNLFKELNKKDIECFICVTRQEGLLKEGIVDFSKYLYLNKKKAIDFQALLKLNDFITAKKIDILHAHGTSFFLATLFKVLFKNNIMLIWHDHYGNSDFLEQRSYTILKFCSRWFNGVICVNKKLLTWGQRTLLAKNFLQVNNFVSLDKGDKNIIQLKDKNSFKLICIANIRPQKNHKYLIECFKKLNRDGTLSLHLFGKDFKDQYSEQVKTMVNEIKNVYYYGSQPISKAVLEQADVGILVSRSEGLPLAILEYGMANLPVICTDVGECKEVIGDYGIVIKPNNENALLKAIESYLKNRSLRQFHKNGFTETVLNKFSAEKNIDEFIDFYQQCS